MNPIFVDLGILEIKWYSVMIFIGLVIGGFYVMKESHKFKISEDELINLIFWLIPISLLGARLYYVLFNWSYYGANKGEILQVWNGGLAIHGGILSGLIYIIYYTKKNKIDTLRLLDMTAVALLVGQAIGRWGNFFNQEAYGSVVSLSFLENLKLPSFIIEGMYINGAYHHPTFLYESIWCFIGFIILLVLRKKKYLKIGIQTSLYFIYYSVGRFLIEYLRTDSLMLGNLKAAQIVSILMIIIGVLMYIWVNRGSKFERLYIPLRQEKADDLPTILPNKQIMNENIVDENKQVEEDLYKW